MMFNKNNIKGFITPHQKRAWWMHNNIKIFIVLLAINIILFVFSSIIEPNFIQNLKNEQYKYALEVLNLYLEENVDTSYVLYMFRDDLSSYAKEKNITTNVQSTTGKFVYHAGESHNLIIDWHLENNFPVIDEVVLIEE